MAYFTKGDSRVQRDIIAGRYVIVTNPALVRFKDTGANQIDLRAPSAVTASYVITLPATAPTTNQVLIFDGANYIWGNPGAQALTVFTGTTASGAATDGIALLTNAAARSYTLPTSPANGTAVTVKDGAGTAGTANITVSGGGGNSVESGQAVINFDNGSITYVYRSENTTWYAV